MTYLNHVYSPPPPCAYYAAGLIRRIAARLWQTRASRSLADLDIRVRPLAEAFLADAADAGLDLFVYTTYRSLAEQAGKVEAGVSWTPRGWHNLLNAETQEPAARAIDYAFRGPVPWSPGHRWDRARAIGELHGATYEVWHKGDLGHAVWTLGESFGSAWAAQAAAQRHHPAKEIHR